MDEAMARRMAFVRYLLDKAVVESEHPEPMCSAALLEMHDAVELFLQLACESRKVGQKRPEFMDYFDLLAPTLAGGALAEKEGMRRLNKARVGLKHSGVHPSRREIEDLRSATLRFFDENTRLVFGVPLSDVSLSGFVEPLEVRSRLEEAQTELKEGNAAKALALAAMAFDQLVRTRGVEYKERTGGGVRRRIGSGATRVLRECGREVERLGEEIVGAIEELQEEARLGVLGFDEEQSARLSRLAPAIALTTSGKYVTEYWKGESEYSAEDAAWSIDFVARMALATKKRSAPHR